MYIRIVKGDITEQETDAIVNAANKQLIPGGGVDGAITRAAGEKALNERMELGSCEIGEAKIACGGDLKADYIIYTVGPIYKYDNHELLSNAYKSCMEIAISKGLKSIAFPAISAGIFGYPADLAASVALNTIMEYWGETDIEVVFVLFVDDVFHEFAAKALQLVSDNIDVCVDIKIKDKEN